MPVRHPWASSDVGLPASQPSPSGLCGLVDGQGLFLQRSSRLVAAIQHEASSVIHFEQDGDRNPLAGGDSSMNIAAIGTYPVTTVKSASDCHQA